MQRRNLLRLVPITLLVCACLLLDWYALNTNGRFAGPDVVGELILGAVGGQFLAILLIAGFATRTWVSGTLLAGLLVGVGWFVVWYSRYAQGDLPASESEVFTVSFIFPSWVLVSATPLLVCRQWLGWRLTLDGSDTVPRRHMSIEGMMWLMSVLAALLMIVRVHREIVVATTPNYLPVAGILCAIGFTVALVIVLPLSICALRLRRIWLACITLMLVSALQVGLLSLISHSFGNRSPIAYFFRDPVYAFIGLLAPTVLACLCLRLCGITLAKFAPKSESVSDDIAASAAENRRVRINTRIWGGLILVVGIITSLGSDYIVYYYTPQYLQDQVRSRLAKTGGEVVFAGAEWYSPPQFISIGKLGNDKTLAWIAGDIEDSSHLTWTRRQVRELSLAGSQVTTKGLRQLDDFPHLRALDLSGLTIAEETLDVVSEMKLSRLSLARTDVDYDLLVRYPQLAQSLDLSGTNVDREHLRWLGENFHALRLRNCKLTDNDVRALVRRGCANDLELSGNPITGAGFDHPAKFKNLRLDRTLLDDETIEQFATNVDVTSLSLRDTKLTDAGVKELARMKLRDLTICGDEITDDGIAELRSCGVSSLKLPSRKITGRCFQGWLNRIETLDLSDSGITDETMPHLSDRRIGFLRLARTKITDGALVTLRDVRALVRLDICGTEISARGILTLDVGRVIVERNQFSVAELAAIRDEKIVQVLD